MYQQQPGAGGFGINPDAGGPPGENQWRAGGGGYDFGQILQALMSQYQPQESPSEALITKKMLQDPVGYYNKMASLPSNAPGSLSPFAPGGQFENVPRLTPAAQLASQGNTATNQWAQMGGVEGMDPEELKRFNRQTALSRRTYM
jgi:hypothetical protein